MPTLTHPSEIAREVLRLIATRRLPPTPDNFRTLYHEVSGQPEAEAPFSRPFAKEISARLPRDNAERLRLARELDQALTEADTEAARRALFAYFGTLESEAPPAWNVLIGTLLRQWENRQIGWTTARKRESLERVLAANDPATLFTRLQGLVNAWDQAPDDPEQSGGISAPGTAGRNAPAASATSTAIRLLAPAESGEILERLRELLVLSLDTVVPATLGESQDLLDEAAKFAAAVKAAGNAEELRAIGMQLKKFAYRLELQAGDTAEVRAGMMNLFHLLLANIDQIVIDDQWLKGQIDMLRELVNGPTSPRVIDDAERRLKEVIYKQSQLKHSLAQAQLTLKSMLAGFVDQLASFTESTSSYHDKIALNAQRIGQARDIGEIGNLLDDVMRDTRAIQEEARRSRDELRTARDQANQAEARIQQLQHELDEASRAMRHDQLTGSLNRRGLEETFRSESARAIRRRTPLCVALLDIDNFKALNDSFGHQAGDDALIHLVSVVRTNLRPEDTVARLGGEEFVLLYPDTELEQARAALIRLQRELTKAYFLNEDKRLLITFSAGVSEWRADESMETVIQRADAAMYEAKRTGKNKVVVHPASH